MRWLPLSLLLWGGCTAPPVAPKSPLGTVPAFAQRPGDPQKGWETLTRYPYVTCGVPRSAYDQAFPPAPEEDRIAERSGESTDLPYNRTGFKVAVLKSAPC